MKKLIFFLTILGLVQFSFSQITDTGGNIGIGNTTPATKLSFGNEYYTGIPTGSNIINKISLWDDGTTKFGFGISSSALNIGITGTGGCAVNFWTAATKRMTIDGNGNIGIGTTSPIYKLEVGTGAAGFQFNSTTQTIGGQFGDGGNITLTGGTPDNVNMGAALFIGGSSRGDNYKNVFAFFSGGGTGTEYMRIDGDYTGHTIGNVGIGTTSPDTKLDVIGKAVFGSANISGASYNEGLSIHNSTGENTSLLLWQHGIASGKIGFISNDNKLRIVNTFTDGSLSNSAAIVLDATGNVGIGTTNPGEFKLAVAGKIHATEIQVDALPWPDFVFSPTYNLRTLAEVEAFVNQNQHLPDVPNEAQVAAEGISLGEMNAILLQKIEELTLYTITQQKEIECIKVANSELKRKIEDFETIKSDLESIKIFLNK